MKVGGAMVAILTLCSCEWTEGTKHDASHLGNVLWRIAYDDLTHINRTFELVSNYYYMLSIEDAAERQQYAQVHLGTDDITIEDNIHTLTYSTLYNTTYKVTIEMNDTSWCVTRSGGSGYRLIITPEDDNYRATFESLYNKESKGHGEFVCKMTFENDRPTIQYNGGCVMVDSSADAKRPLTVTTNIINDIVYSGLGWMREGKISITAKDALYGTTDSAIATMLRYERKVVVETMGTTTTYEY